jgi:hypothetical protein
MFLLRLCVRSSVRASQTHHGESDRHGATGRKEDLHGHKYNCFNPHADALIGATILGIVRRETDWEGLLQNQRRDQAPPGAWHWEQRHLSHAACFIQMSGFNREAKNVQLPCAPGCVRSGPS